MPLPGWLRNWLLAWPGMASSPDGLGVKVSLLGAVPGGAVLAENSGTWSAGEVSWPGWCYRSVSGRYAGDGRGVHTPLVVRGSLRAVLGLNSPVALVRDSALRVARESASDMVRGDGGRLFESLVFLEGRCIRLDMGIEVMLFTIRRVAAVQRDYMFLQVKATAHLFFCQHVVILRHFQSEPFSLSIEEESVDGSDIMACAMYVVEVDRQAREPLS